jgi:hypothetical protein
MTVGFPKLVSGFVLYLLIHFFMNPTARAFEFGQNPEKMQFSLLTIGRGDAVYALYGHTILRANDLETGQDVGFNWGMFDFHDKLFVWNFYRSNLRYQMAMIPTAELLNHYRLAERRGVIEDKIRLTNEQKIRLIERLRWNLKPENISYDYEQFKDNCSTRPRDHIDFALQGAIQRRFANAKTSQTFRDAIRNGAALVPWVYLGLDQFTNHILDLKMTIWQSMFIPSSLREALLQMPAIDDQAQFITEQNLLYGSQILVDLEEPSAISQPYSILAVVLLFPTGILGTLALYFRNRLGLTALKFIWGFFGLYSGLMGFVLLLNLLVSGYPQLKNKSSLLILNPLDFCFFAASCGWLFQERKWLLKSYAMLRIFMVICASYLWFSGIINQDIVGTLGTGGVLTIWVSMITLLRTTHGSEASA